MAGARMTTHEAVVGDSIANIFSMKTNLGSDDSSEKETAETNNMGTSPEVSGHGITDVMSKILGKAVPEIKGIILAKGQSDKDITRKKKLKRKEENGEEGISDKKKRKKPQGDEESDSSDENDEVARRKRRIVAQKKRDWVELGRMKPNILNKEKERMLQRIATSGVVRIFNAVRLQQGSVREKMSEAGSSLRRRDKVLGSISKKHFLDLLDSTQSKKASAPGADVKDRPTGKMQDDSTSEQPEGKWSVLREDYLRNARMKDWDRDSDHEEND